MRRVLLGFVLASVVPLSGGAVAISAGAAPVDLRHETETAAAVERWAVKTLTDPAAGDVKSTPRTTSVLGLPQLDVPKVTDSTPRLPDVEHTTYCVRAPRSGRQARGRLRHPPRHR